MDDHFPLEVYFEIWFLKWNESITGFTEEAVLGSLRGRENFPLKDKKV